MNNNERHRFPLINKITDTGKLGCIGGARALTILANPFTTFPMDSIQAERSSTAQMGIMALELLVNLGEIELITGPYPLAGVTIALLHRGAAIA